MRARCTETCLNGERCREQRLEWLRVVEDEGRLRYICTAHMGPEYRSYVTAVAMRDFMIGGGHR